jgi:hypothetical protein
MASEVRRSFSGLQKLIPSHTSTIIALSTKKIKHPLRLPFVGHFFIAYPKQETTIAIYIHTEFNLIGESQWTEWLFRFECVILLALCVCVLVGCFDFFLRTE